MAVAGRGIFETGCGIRVGWRTAGRGGEGGLVSVFQGFFAGINKILNLARGLGARVALGH